MRKEYIGIIPHRASVGALTIVLPIYLLDIGARATDVGFTLFMGSIGTLLGVILWGNFSARGVGYKELMSIGVISFSLMLFGIYSIRSIFAISLIYFLGNLFFAAVVPAITKVAFEISSKEEWEYEQGKLNTIAGWSWAGGVIFSLMLSPILTTREMLLVFSTMNILALPLLFITVKTRRKRRTLNKNRKVYRKPFLERVRFAPLIMFFLPSLIPPKNKELYPFFLSVFIVFFVSGLAIPQIIVYSHHQYSNKMWSYLLYSFMTLFSNLWYIKASVKLSHETSGYVFYYGVMMRTLGLGVFAFSPAMGIALAPVAILGAIFIGISWAYISISNLSYVGRVAKEDERGGALAFYNFINGLAVSLGNFTGGLMADTLGFTNTFLFAIILLTAGAMFMRKIEFSGAPTT